MFWRPIEDRLYISYPKVVQILIWHTFFKMLFDNTLWRLFLSLFLLRVLGRFFWSLPNRTFQCFIHKRRRLVFIICILQFVIRLCPILGRLLLRRHRERGIFHGLITLISKNFPQIFIIGLLTDLYQLSLSVSARFLHW